MSNAELDTARVRSDWALLPLAGGLALLYLISLYDYSIYHTLVEAMSITVATAVFIVVFHTRRLLDNHYLLFVSIGLLAFVALGVPHTLGYKGIALFHGFDNDLPTQAFVAQRFVLAGSFLLAPLFLRRRLNVTATSLAFGALTIVVLSSLLVWRNFPSMFMEPGGLTPLKKWLEVVLSAMFVGGAIGLYRNRLAFAPNVMRLTLVSLVCFAASELSFMLYASPFGLSNLLGHTFQVAAFWFIYRAVLVTALVNPFGLLFRQLADRESSLIEANMQLNAIAEVSDAAISSLDRETLGSAVLERLVAVMSADAALLMLFDGEVLRTAGFIGMDEPGFSLNLGEGLAGSIAASRRPDFIEDIQADTARIKSPFLRDQGIRSILGVPLLNGEQLIGVIHVDWRTVHRFNEAEIRLLSIIGDRVALALSNSQMYENEHHIAQVLQESLLALPDTVDGVCFSSAYQSASQAARVGGDFYDVFELDHARVGILVGDVSGKGLEAAVQTSLLRNTVRAHAVERGKTPGDILGLTNTVFEKATDPGTFATVFFAVLDRRDGVLSYCNAGHTAAAILRPDGAVGQLPANSPLVGAFPDSIFCSSSTTVGEGELLFLYTDGVIESRCDTTLYGEERLFEFLATQTACEPARVVEAVMQEIVRFSGSALSDDVALLAVQPCESSDGRPVQQSLLHQDPCAAPTR
ncbi:MAG: MASE3 domain-containing protein [Coriobacteriia bacterium]